MNLRDLTESDMGLTVWRYMPFAKFISLLSYQALWFSKLNILEDQYEGKMPRVTKLMMEADHQTAKRSYSQDQHWQFDEMATKNEDDSRELLVVSCWYLDEHESRRMWSEYGMSAEAVAIKSTVQRLRDNVGVPQDKNATHMGRVKYVDHDQHQMSKFHASQGHERAFIKDGGRFQHERELRILTLNFKTTWCVRPDGHLYTLDDLQGGNSNNFHGAGLHFTVRLPQLIDAIVVSPFSQEWFYLMIRRVIDISGLKIPVVRSTIASVDTQS